LIKQLKECTTLGQADPILAQLNAGPAVKKLVETSIILSTSPDEQQRNHAFSFMKSAIQELERNEGSHQSSTSYHPKKATNVKGGMMGAADTQNQITSEFAQMLSKQSKDYLKNYHETHVKPMMNDFKKEMDAQVVTQEEIDDDIIKLKKENENLKENQEVKKTPLDVVGITELMRHERIKETAGIPDNNELFPNVDTRPYIEILPYKDLHPLETARSEIEAMDRMLKDGNTIPSE